VGAQASSAGARSKEPSLPLPTARPQATDAYSFGVLLWQMWTGSRPWPGLRAWEVARAVSDGGTLAFPEGTPAAIRSIGEVRTGAMGQGAWVGLGEEGRACMRAAVRASSPSTEPPPPPTMAAIARPA
jgi:hypothetical protein